MDRQIGLIVLISLVFLAGCEEPGASGDTPAEPYTSFFTPLPEAAVFPEGNDYSDAKRALGEFLFWDPILSGRMNVSCATCHHPDHAWADGRMFSIGVDGMGLGPGRSGSQETPFHSPSVLNVAYTGLPETQPDPGFVSGGYFWDLRVATLEDQALEPIRSEVEMRSSDFLEEEIMPEILLRLSLIPEYQDLFSSAFEGPDPISEENIAKALATYQRTLTTEPTRFDRFLAGDDTALTAAEITGLNKFINGGCTDCHSGPMLSDNLIDPTKPVQVDRPAVRTPTLRNVELTPPYMHDGSRATLGDAIALYEERDDLGVTLEDDDFGDIERFLRTLTDDAFSRDIPDYVPSQLPVGGDIL
ncbi:MAG: cytochrome c peroxidase [Woeseiaceae bacterium]|nr:cytochrome c peroxidase [Woeseiaceae bacterium]